MVLSRRNCLDDKSEDPSLQVSDSSNAYLTPHTNEIVYCGSEKKDKAYPQFKDERLKEGVICFEFSITDDPLVLLDIGEPLSAEDEDKLKAYLVILKNKNSIVKKNVVEDLKILAERYQTPFIWENLKVAYELHGDFESAKATQTEINLRFPNYLYSRFTVAAQALSEKQFEKFTKCFDDCENLSQLYPERKVFHISEIILFHFEWLAYSAAISDLQKGEAHFAILSKVIDENHSSFSEAKKLIEMLRLQQNKPVYSSNRSYLIRY